jgi:hypothetical protein
MILKKRIKQLESVEKAKPEIKDGVYYVGEDGPFCSACQDNNEKLIRLTPLGEIHRFFGKWKCPVCKAFFGKTG